MEPRREPYIWVTWLTQLLVGENQCEWKAWMKAHYKVDTLSADEMLAIYPESQPFDSEKWNENHTALMNELYAEYAEKCAAVFREVEWKIKGSTTGTTLAGKVDLIPVEPNLIVDAKSGKAKDSHHAQVRIYHLAMQMGKIPGFAGEFKGVLRYADGSEVRVRAPDETFKRRLFTLIKRIGGPEEVAASPSYNECKFCDIAGCKVRCTEDAAAATTEEW